MLRFDDDRFDRFDFIFGTWRGGILTGTTGNDAIRGRWGDDTIFGGTFTGNGSSYDDNGDDFIFAGRGDDWISAGGGHDTIHAGIGDNEVHVGTGMNNVYLRGGGRDLVGAPEVDWLDPLDGRNLIHVDKDGGRVHVYGASSRTHIDVLHDDEIAILSQRLVDDSLVIRALDDDTTIRVGMDYWLPGQEARLLSPIELDGLFV